MITSQVELITPAVARKYLEKNIDNNRHISERTVAVYANDMKNRNWRITHQGIAFNTDGKLVDGQHRLMAVIKADTPVKMMVTRGLDAESMRNIDQNRPRTSTDSLRIAGYTDPIIANTRQISFIRFLNSHKLHGTQKLTVDEIIAFHQAYGDVCKLAWRLSMKSNNAPAPVMVACVSAVLNGVPVAACEAFLRTITSNVIDPDYNCKAALDFAQWKTKLARQGATERGDMCFRCENAIHMFVTGKIRVFSPFAERYPVTAQQVMDYKFTD